MKMVSLLRTALFSILYPRTCPMCGAYTGEQTERGKICDRCLQLLPRTEQDVLRENNTEFAFTKVPHFERGAAFLFFEKDHPIQQLIHKMKYTDQPLIGYQLGRQAALEFQYSDFFEGMDVIVPMPLHPKRLRERGYNQAEYIARGISEITGIPIDTTHVTRIRNTPQQALQDGEERKTNVANAFAVNHPEEMRHKHILVVDDLITTGETMRSCLAAMKRFRGATFSVFALCKAR